jgi:hypothetical protein
VLNVGFEQASIPVEKEKEFSELRGAIEAGFAPERVGKLLATLKSKGVRIRDFDLVLAKRVIESAAQQKVKAQELYRSLTVSDQGQIREFYLVQVEQVPSELRRKFNAVYRDF